MEERKNRIDEALNLRGLKAVDLVERAGVGKSSLSHWINQHWQPKQKALYKMASVLEVSELWLAGYDVDRERSVEQIEADKTAQLLHTFKERKNLMRLCIELSDLNDEQLVLIQSMVNQLKK